MCVRCKQCGNNLSKSRACLLAPLKLLRPPTESLSLLIYRRPRRYNTTFNDSVRPMLLLVSQISETRVDLDACAADFAEAASQSVQLAHFVAMVGMDNNTKYTHNLCSATSRVGMQSVRQAYEKLWYVAQFPCLAGSCLLFIGFVGFGVC